MAASTARGEDRRLTALRPGPLHVLTVTVACLVLLALAADDHHFDWIHALLTLSLIPLTLGSVRRARGKADQQLIQGLLASGLALVIAAPVGREAWGVGTAAVLTIAGCGLVLTGHVRNQRD